MYKYELMLMRVGKNKEKEIKKNQHGDNGRVTDIERFIKSTFARLFCIEPYNFEFKKIHKQVIYM